MWARDFFILHLINSMNKQYTKFTSGVLAILCALNITSVAVHASDGDKPAIPQLDFSNMLNLDKLKSTFQPATEVEGAYLKITRNEEKTLLSLLLIGLVVEKLPRAGEIRIQELTQEMVNPGIAEANRRLVAYGKVGAKQTVTTVLSGRGDEKNGFLLTLEYAMNRRVQKKEAKNGDDEEKKKNFVTDVFVELANEYGAPSISAKISSFKDLSEAIANNMEKNRAKFKLEDASIAKNVLTSDEYPALATVLSTSVRGTRKKLKKEEIINAANLQRILRGYNQADESRHGKVGECLMDKRAWEVGKQYFDRIQVTEAIIEYLAILSKAKSANAFLQTIDSDLTFKDALYLGNKDNDIFTLAWWKSESTKTWKKFAAGGTVGGVLVLVGGVIAWFAKGKGRAAEPSADQKDALVDTDEEDDDFDA